MILKYIAGPLIGSAIGYFTNFIAVKMLFHPKNEVKLLGHTLPFTPGAIPKGKSRLAKSVGDAVGNNLITQEDIEKKLTNDELAEKIADMVLEKLSLPMNDAFTGGTDINQEDIKGKKEAVSKSIAKFIAEAISQVDISGIIIEKAPGIIMEKLNNPMISQDDLNDGTSVSITTQMAVAREYCKENRFQIVDFYCDDGYTGTNFNRPEFKRMMKDVEKGRVNLVIVKDLSRFGREHIMVDSYTQVYFPENGIRFIAIYDNIDITPRSHYDLMMNIKSVINEYYPAEVSGKVRNSFDVKTKNGEFLHPTVPYGYKKSSTQKNKLEIDYEYAPVIVKIFEMIAYQGIGVTNVANMLYEQKIPNPTALKELKDGQIKSANPYRWNKSTIYGILNNQVYLGKMINGKTRKVSFKSDKIFKADESEWVVAENAHEAIISQELWDNAHMRVNQRKRKCNPNQPENMFKGILTCMDCDSTMRVFNPKKKSRYFVCSKSQCRVAGDFRCSTHNIKYDVLEESVLRDINLMIKMLKTDEEAFMNQVLGNIRMDEGSEERICNELSDINKQIDRQTKKYKKLYDDYYDGIIHDSKLFEEMAAECEEKRQYYLTRKSQLEEELESATKVFEDSERFIRLLKKYDYITELSSELLNTLIEKITVGEKTYVEPNKVVQKVKIYYKFVGLVGKCE